MPNDGLNINKTTNVVSPERTTTKEQIKRLEALEDKLWAILGLKMACDKLRTIGYEVVVQQEGTKVVVHLDLKVDFDFDTGIIAGKDVVVVQKELARQIKELKERL